MMSDFKLDFKYIKLGSDFCRCVEDQTPLPEWAHFFGLGYTLVLILILI